MSVQTVEVSEQPLRLLNRYEVLEVLSEDPVSPVYLLCDEKDRKILRSLSVLVAGKTFINPSASRREWLKNEIELSHDYRHSSLVNLYDYSSQAELSLLTMEYVPGLSLQDCETMVYLNAFQIFSVTRQLLQSLDYIHGHGQLHGRLDSRSVILRKDGTIKLLMWGHRAETPITMATDFRAACEIILTLFKSEIIRLESSQARRLRATLRQLVLEALEEPDATLGKYLQQGVAKIEQIFEVPSIAKPKSGELLDEILIQTNRVLVSQSASVIILVSFFISMFLIFLAIFGEKICIDLLGLRISNLNG